MSEKPTQTESSNDNTSDQPAISRRAIFGLVGLSGIGLLSGQSAASQDSSNQSLYDWSKDVDANDHTLQNLGALEMADNSTAIRNFAGDNLHIDEGVLHADLDDDQPTVQPDFVYVDEFGAEGDGETDDSQAIQEAADSIENKAALVFSPGKRYLLQDTVTIDVDNVRAIYGNNAYIVLDDDIIGLDVRGNKDEPGSGPDWEIQHELKYDEFSTIIKGLQIYSKEYTGVGIQLREQFATIVSDCHLFNLDHGIQIGDFTRNLILSDNNIWDNRTSGIHMTGEDTERDRADLHQINVANSHISYARNSILIEDSFHVFNLQISNCCMEAQTDQQDGFESFVNAQGPVQEMHVATTNFQDHNVGDDALLKFEGEIAIRVTIASSYINLTDGDGIRMEEPEEVSFVGNIFDRLEGDAVILNGGHEIAVNSNVFHEVSGDAIQFNGSNRFTAHGNVMNDIDASSVALTNAVQTGHVSDNQAYNVETFLNAGTTDSVSGMIIDGNNIRPRTASAMLLDVDDDIHNISLSNNSLYWNDTECDSDEYAIDVSCSDLIACTMTDNRVSARNGEFDGMRVDPTGTAEGVRIKGNIVDGLAVDTSPFSFPDPSENSVIVDENLNVR